MDCYILSMSLFNFTHEDTPFEIDITQEENSVNFIKDNYNILSNKDRNIVEFARNFYQRLFNSYHIKPSEIDEEPTKEEVEVFYNIYKYFKEISDIVIAMGHGYIYAQQCLGNFKIRPDIDIDIVLNDTGCEPRLTEEGYASPYEVSKISAKNRLLGQLI